MYLFTLSRKKIIRGLLLIVVFILTITCIYGTGVHSVFFGYASKKLPIYYVKTDEKKVAISFDCAWGVDYTDKLLTVMKEENVYCTFFMVEFWAKKYPEHVKKIDDYGHEIGTHSATHPHMSKLNSETMIKELSTSKQVIEDLTGKKVELFRPPFGEYNDLLIETATQLGLYTIQWDVDSLDWKNLSAKEISDRVLSKVKNGSIVLFHNQGLHTAEALPTIIKGLKNKGYTFVPIGELIYKDNFKMAVDGAQVKNL